MPSRSPTDATDLPGFRLRYRKNPTLGETTGIEIEVLGNFLDRGYRIWARSRESKSFEKLCERISGLEAVWDKDLQVIEFVCACPSTVCYLKSKALLHAQPSRDPSRQVVATDHAVVYMPDLQEAASSTDGQDPWAMQEVTRQEWQPIDLPTQRWRPGPERDFDLRIFGGASQQTAHVAMAMVDELKVGRLHRGPDRNLNQSGSGKGSHWHLGWQRFVIESQLKDLEKVTPEELDIMARDWMSRWVCSLKVNVVDELQLEVHPGSDPPQEARLRSMGPTSWELTIRDVNCLDSIRIYAEESKDQTGQLKLVWLWAARCEIEPEMEDRYYLWLPWRWESFDLAQGMTGQVGSRFRWLIDNSEIVLIDEGLLSETANPAKQ